MKAALLAALALASAWNPERMRTAMQAAMGPLPAPSRAPLDPVTREETRTGGYLLRKLDFASGDGDRVPAYLLIPEKRAGRLGAVLALHQTVAIGKAEPAGLGGKPNLHYASELAGRGYIVLAPDYPGYGDYKSDPYAMGYVSATMKGIRNHMRAIDLLVSMPEVDPRRIGAVGHSLGGHNALFVAAFDRRIAAVATSCGFTSFRKYMGGDLNGWSHRGYMPRIAELYGKRPERMPFDFSDVLAAIAPRPVFVNAPRGDTNFDWSGVDDSAADARRFGARVTVIHPDASHDFPPDAREQAYRFFDRELKR